MPSSPSELLDSWLAVRADAHAREWLSAKIDGARKSGAVPAFFLAFSAAPRKVGRADLGLTQAELGEAADARPGWQPGLWSTSQAARTRLVLALPERDASSYRSVLDQLFDDGDLGELIALYQALPLLPHPEEHRARAAEGIRSNMNAVFEAVALRNPYPSEALDEPAWNQLVLKCLFVGSPLYLVHGIDGRVNRELARMLSDYAHERWAANRLVSPELWRCVGPVADGPLLADLERVLATGAEIERAGAALAARHNPSAEGVLGAHTMAVDRALAAYPTWEAVAQEVPRRETP